MRNTADITDRLRAIVSGMGGLDEAEELALLSDALDEIERLTAILWTPEVMDFAKGIVEEAAHQRVRWGEEHDRRKTPEDWLWVVAYLSTKAIQAHRYGDRTKYLHHIVTTAAACANWHRIAIAEETLDAQAEEDNL